MLCEAQHCAGRTGNCCARVATECDIGPRVCRNDNRISAPPGYCVLPPLPPRPPQSPPAPPFPPSPPVSPPSPPFMYGASLDVVYFSSCTFNVTGSTFLIATVLLSSAARKSFALRLLVPLAFSTAGFAIVLLAIHPIRPPCGIGFAALTYFKWAQSMWTLPFAATVCRSILRSAVLGDTTGAELPLRLEVAYHVLCWMVPLAMLMPAVRQRRFRASPPLGCALEPFLLGDMGENETFLIFFVYEDGLVVLTLLCNVLAFASAVWYLHRVDRRVSDGGGASLVHRTSAHFLIYIAAYILTQTPTLIFDGIELWSTGSALDSTTSAMWLFIVGTNMHGFVNAVIYGLTNRLIVDHWCRPCVDKCCGDARQLDDDPNGSRPRLELGAFDSSHTSARQPLALEGAESNRCSSRAAERV